jgi:hypothetical protein
MKMMRDRMQPAGRIRDAKLYFFLFSPAVAVNYFHENGFANIHPDDNQLPVIAAMPDVIAQSRL